MTAILIVEDDPQLGPLLVTLLRQSGYDRMFLACDAPDARRLAVAHRDEIDLLVTDLGLPSQRGDALAAELSALLPRIGVVLISGLPGERQKVGVSASWRVLDKPFSREALLRAVTEALRNRGKTVGAISPAAPAQPDRGNSGSTSWRPDRVTTNESLRAERGDIDREIDRRDGAEGSADDIVMLAREHADAVLGAARGKADQAASSEGQDHDGVADERAREDDVVQDERDAADSILRTERESNAAVLNVVLPLQRLRTDRDLLLERTRSDDKIARRDDFLAMVSHDLRSLLCGILLEMAAVTDESSESAEGRRTVAAMKRLEAYTARMSSLIGDLVDVVSIDAGRLAVRPLRGDLSSLLREAVDLFARSAAAAGITLETDIEPLLLADFDRERMLQVLANLIGNAIKFSPRGARITVRGATAGNQLRLSVSDTGMGIPANMLESVFQRFWQAGPADQRGLGLGLYITKCLVEAHGGRIWAESKTGEGSAFSISLPSAAPA